MNLEFTRILAKYDTKVAELTRANILLEVELEQTREQLEKLQKENEHDSKPLEK